MILYPTKLLLQYKYLCCIMDRYCKLHPDPPLASSTITTQSQCFWLTKIMGSHSFLHFYFHRTSLHGFAVYGLTNVFGMFVFFISLPYLTRLQWNLYYSLPYAYSTSLALYRLKFIHNPTLEGTLHSKVKYFTTHNSVVMTFVLQILREY